MCDDYKPIALSTIDHKCVHACSITSLETTNSHCDMFAKEVGGTSPAVTVIPV